MSESSIGAHFQELYRSAPPRFAFRAESPTALAAWQTEFRRELRSALGLDQMEAELAGQTPQAEQHDAETLDGFTREHGYLRVKPAPPLNPARSHSSAWAHCYLREW